MAKSTKSETVPKAMREKFERITTITDEFAQQHLNDEYKTMIRQATAALCRKRPSPLTSGRDKTWACGITHAIGMVNFLFDSSQTPHISAKNLYAEFGVSASAGQAKSKLVRDTLDMSQMDPDWWLPSRMDDNPLAWLISVDGMILDARSAPPEVQTALAAAGLIPHVSATAAKSSPAASSPATSEVSESPPPDRPPNTLYTLDAHIIDGPLTEEFVDENPQMTRRIEIKGDQTLAALHEILFTAFDREEEHLYEFQVGGRGPNDPTARRYGLKLETMGDPEDSSVANVAQTTMNELGLAEGEVFGYWFDFGDDWWHAIEVMSIQLNAGNARYPKITHRIGASPPQYADFEE